MSARARVALLALLLAAAGASGARAEVGGQLEPGVALGHGDCLLPLALQDAAGAPFAARREEITLRVGGETVRDFSLGAFAPAPGGEPSAQLLILDPPDALDARGRRDWAERAEDFLATGGGLQRGVAAAGPGLERWVRLGGAAPGAEALESRLAAGAQAAGERRLWDSVLEGLALLSRGKLPARRVLILVSDGDEPVPSSHPQASCLEAARLARVPVYVLALAGDDSGAGHRRLAALAAGSGGRLFDAAGNGTSAWQDLLRAVEGVQALQFRAPAPAESTPLLLELAGAGGGRFKGTLARRTRVAAGADRRLLFLLLLPLLAAAGAVIVLHRRGGVGRLLLVDVDGQVRRERVLPHGGLSIGSDPSNDLVLTHPHISRQHAVVTPRRGAVLLTDLRSTNGTQVNGRAVSSQILQDGDRLLLGGSVELVFTRTRRRSGRRQ